MDAVPITVTELTEHIKGLLELDPSLRRVLVRGELSNYKIYPSGHHYFTLKDNGAAELFGTVTFGKGIVQTFFNINFGKDGTIKFTTDAYYTPADVCIQGTGISPDHIVELPEGLTYYNIPSIPYESDTQLQAAVEYLRGLDR